MFWIHKKITGKRRYLLLTLRGHNKITDERRYLHPTLRIHKKITGERRYLHLTLCLLDSAFLPIVFIRDSNPGPLTCPARVLTITNNYISKVQLSWWIELLEAYLM